MSSDTPSREIRLQEIIAAFLDAVASGQAPDRECLLAAHPDLADDLRAFFVDHDHMSAAAAPVRAVLDHDSADHSEPAEPFPQLFGDYELLEEIGRGGMGVVYKARQLSLDRIVALKRIRAGQLASADEVARFRREAEAAAGLDHPNIVPILEVGEHEGQHFFTMKLIEGGNLNAHLAEYAADGKATAGLMIAIARAVHHAHQRGILHRDLKPGNILIDAAGSPHVSDFGLAQPIEKEAKLTQSGAIVGTAETMAPEQARGEKGLTTAADVYGLGAVLYVLLTRRPPFQGDYNWETLKKVVEEEPRSPRSLNSKANRDLETICLKCLAKQPAKRYSSAEALAEDLERWQEGKPIQARRAGVTERLWKWTKRRPARAALLAAALVLSILGTVLFLQFRDLAVLTELAANREVAFDSQKQLATEQSKLARERQWASLSHQALGERLDGKRWEALATLKKLADLRRDFPELGDRAFLQREAFLVATMPGLRKLREDKFHYLRDIRISTDGETFLGFGNRPYQKDGDNAWWLFPPGKDEGIRIEGTRTNAHRSHYHDPCIFAPLSKAVFFSREPPSACLLVDTASGRVLAEVRNCPFSPESGERVLVSPDGQWQAVGGCYWKTGEEHTLKVAPGRALAFVSNRELRVKSGVPGTDNEQDLVFNLLTGEKKPAEKVLALPTRSYLNLVVDQKTGVGTIHDSIKGILCTIPDAFESRGGWDPPGPWSLFTSDNRFLVLPGKLPDDPMRLYDTGTGRLVRSVGPLGKGHWPYALRTDGRVLVSVPSKGKRQLHLWDLETGAELATFPAPGAWPPVGVVWSSNGRSLVVAGRHVNTESFSVWEFAFPHSSHVLPSPASSLQFAPDGARLAVDGAVWGVDGPDGRKFLRPASPVADLVFFGNAGQTWQVHIPQPYREKTGILKHRGTKEPIKIVQVGTTKREWQLPRTRFGRVFSWGEIKRDLIGDLLGQAETETQQKELAEKYGVTLLPDTGKVREYRRWYREMDPEMVAVRFFGLSPDGKHACVLYQALAIQSNESGGWPQDANTQLEVWRLEEDSAKLIWKLPFYGSEAGQEEWLPITLDRKWWAHAKELQAVYAAPIYFDQLGLRFWLNLVAGSFPVAQRDFRSGLKSATRSDKLRWDIHEASGWYSPEHWVTVSRYCCTVSPDGRHVIGSAAGTIHVEKGPPEPWQAHQGPVLHVAVSPDNSLLVSAGFDSKLRLWDMTNGKELLTWPGHEDEVTALAFHPDGKTLVTAGKEGTLKVWNLEHIRQDLTALGLGW